MIEGAIVGYTILVGTFIYMKTILNSVYQDNREDETINGIILTQR